MCCTPHYIASIIAWVVQKMKWRCHVLVLACASLDADIFRRLHVLMKIEFGLGADAADLVSGVPSHVCRL